MRRFSLVVVVAAVGVVMAGCPPTYPKCNNDENCKDKGEYCVAGQCQQCATNEHCKEGFICQANKCVPKPECTDTSPCPGGAKCEAGKCVAQTAEVTPQLAPGACNTPTDCPGGQDCQEGKCVEARAASCELPVVRFGFNEATLSTEAQEQLRAVADCLRGKPGRMTLEGHADERGTEEYNLALSNRRAAAVRRYLSTLGVSNDQMETVGFGENRPATSAASEEGWAENRRVEFRR